MVTMPKGWGIIVRGDRLGLVEWECPHGVGHPAPYDKQPMFIRDTWQDENYAWGIHGCDGCCEKFHEGTDNPADEEVEYGLPGDPSEYGDSN